MIETVMKNIRNMLIRQANPEPGRFLPGLFLNIKRINKQDNQQGKLNQIKGYAVKSCFPIGNQSNYFILQWPKKGETIAYVGKHVD